MYEDLINRMRELQALAEHCDEHSCDECENRGLCNKYNNKTLSETYKEAINAIEALAGYIQQIEIAYPACGVSLLANTIEKEKEQ